jgi:hypothetical protein
MIDKTRAVLFKDIRMHRKLLRTQIYSVTFLTKAKEICVSERNLGIPKTEPANIHVNAATKTELILTTG